MDLSLENIQQLLEPAQMANEKYKQLLQARLDLENLPSSTNEVELAQAQRNIKESERLFNHFASMVGNLIKNIE